MKAITAIQLKNLQDEFAVLYELQKDVTSMTNSQYYRFEEIDNIFDKIDMGQILVEGLQ